MGSGEAAEKTSGTAISLIENFYKAGFDNDIILSGVNKLLSVTCDEVFAALDIAVLDLGRGASDFINLGAVSGFIRSSAGVEVVKSGSLPVGVLERVKPVITKKVLSAGDVIVLVTDGVFDAFGGAPKLCDFILERGGGEAQTLSDEILAQAAVYCSGAPHDDMTVAVAKIINK
jgi:stage II sporulation protein E